MAETRTDLVVNARAKGFQQVQQQAGKLVDQATKAAANQAKGYTKMAGSTSAYRKEVKELEKQLANLSKQQLATMKAMQGMDKVSNTYKQLKENLKNLGSEAVLTGKKIALTHQAFGPRGATGGPLTARQMGAGGFVQGLAQGGLGISLQRGPGMWRQAAGMAVGGMARAAAEMPFGGVEGLQNLISKAPFLGPLAGMHFGNAMQFAQGSMGVQQARLGAVPFFERPTANIDKARQQAMGKTPGEYENRILTERMGIFAKQENLTEKERTEALWSVQTQLRQDLATGGKGRALAGAQAAGAAAGQPFAEVRKAGRELAGLSEQQALEASMNMLQRGGGTLGQAQQQGMIRAGFAAQTRYGIGPETQGAFLQAGRRGGLAGAGGRAGEAMTDAIAQGMSLGLEGSELQDYMAQMANDIASWKQTGIPLNSKSVYQISGAIAGTGLGGVRGATIGRGLAQAGQQLSAGGVQDTIDLLMLQTMGGFKGGGMEEYEKAQIRLEQMGGVGQEWNADTVKSLVDQLMQAGGGGATGRQVVRQALGRKGIKMTQAETLAFTESNPMQQAKTLQEMGAVAANRPENAGEMIEQAAQSMRDYGTAIGKAANLQNQQNQVGETMIPIMQKLQQSAMNIDTAFVKIAEKPLAWLSGVSDEASAAIKRLADSSGKAADSLEIIAARGF